MPRFPNRGYIENKYSQDATFSELILDKMPSSHKEQNRQNRGIMHNITYGAVMTNLFKFLNLDWIIPRGILKGLLRNPAGNSNSLIRDPFAPVAFLRRHEDRLIKGDRLTDLASTFAAGVRI